MLVTLQILPRTACQACAGGYGCGAGLFSLMLSQRQPRLQLETTLKLKPGEQVWLRADEADINRMARYWYGLPLVLMLLGAASGQWLFAHQGWVDAAALAGLLAGLAVGWGVARKAVKIMSLNSVEVSLSDCRAVTT